MFFNMPIKKVTFEELKELASKVKNEVDLHDYGVRNAVTLVYLTIQYKIKNGSTSVVVITGKGLHSRNQIPKIKPAVMLWFEKNNLKYEVLQNEGRLKIWFEKKSFF